MKIQPFYLSKLTTLTLLLALAQTYQPSTRTQKQTLHHPRKLNPDERKLGLIGTVGGLGGAALGGMAAKSLMGPSGDDKRKLERLRSDIEKEKQAYMVIMMNRSAVIQDIEGIITGSEEKLQQLGTSIVAQIHGLNSLIEASNMKQVKAIKNYLRMGSE